MSKQYHNTLSKKQFRREKNESLTESVCDIIAFVYPI